MADVSGTVTESGPQDGSVKRILWETLTTTNRTGTPIPPKDAQYADRSVQVIGTFGAAATLTMQGSNDGGTTWATLTDPQGNAIAFTAAGIEQITELTQLMRPNLTNGDGSTDIDVYLLMRRQNPMRT